MLSGGSPVPPGLARQVEQRFGVSFTTVYGQTELSPVVTQKFRLAEQIAHAELTQLPPG